MIATSATHSGVHAQVTLSIREFLVRNSFGRTQSREDAKIVPE
jgi:hypothetical protein